MSLRFCLALYTKPIPVRAINNKKLINAAQPFRCAREMLTPRRNETLMIAKMRACILFTCPPRLLFAKTMSQK